MHGNVRPPLAHRAVASVFGIGFLPMAPGTWSSVVAAAAWYFCRPSPEPRDALPWILTAGTVLLGLLSISRLRGAWGHDPSQVVIDEWAGTWTACLMLPLHPLVLFCALVFFRLFDIFKPFGIRRIERIPGPAGIMFDDLLAGVYANLSVHLLLWLNILH